jgi:hypothetical protein
MRIGCIGEEAFSIKDMNFVYAIRHHLFLHIAQIVACADAFQLYAKCIGQFTTFGKKFETNIGNSVALYLTINKYVIHN